MAPEKNESKSHKLVNNVSSPCELCGSRSQIPNLKYFPFTFHKERISKWLVPAAFLVKTC